jgi:hypothetical protein
MMVSYMRKTNRHQGSSKPDISSSMGEYVAHYTEEQIGKESFLSPRTSEFQAAGLDHKPIMISHEFGSEIPTEQIPVLEVNQSKINSRGGRQNSKPLARVPRAFTTPVPGPPLPIKTTGGGQVAYINVLEDGRFQCSTCKQEYADRPGINRHIVKHTIGAVLCPFVNECQSTRGFNRWDHFINHVSNRHAEMDPSDPTMYRVYAQYLHRGTRDNEVEPEHSSRRSRWTSGRCQSGRSDSPLRLDDSSSPRMSAETSAALSVQESTNFTKRQIMGQGRSTDRMGEHSLMMGLPMKKWDNFVDLTKE